MKKPLLILLVLAAVAAAAYFACYHFATRETRRMLCSTDGMEWLRAEFKLTDAQVRAVEKLQADYQPHCMEMCDRITKSGECLATLLEKGAAVTPELEAAVREAAQTQADCHVATLRQAFAIGAQMEPEQAVRYRAVVAARILPKHAHHDMCGHR
jgi:hypothetical protein